MATEAQSHLEYPLYGITFSVHRLSPLFYGTATLDAPTIEHHASAFRDLLAGEVLRGVRVGLAAEDDALARVGGLQSVRWTTLGDEEEWQHRTQMTGDDSTVSHGNGRGIFVEVTYERGAYSAILLHDSGAQDQPGFSNYPVLLTKMPGALRETFLGFLATTFDTRASAMRLPSSFITATVETYFEDITSSEDGSLDALQAEMALRSITKDILVTLSFDVPGATALKSLDITLSKDDTFRMIMRGRKIQETRTLGEASRASGPFMAALRQYLQAHVALDMNNARVSVSRIACGAFVISTEGKLKLLAPPSGSDKHTSQTKATNALVQRLLELTRGSSLSEKPSS